jgi:hypothetical protein
MGENKGGHSRGMESQYVRSASYDAKSSNRGRKALGARGGGSRMGAVSPLPKFFFYLHFKRCILVTPSPNFFKIAFKKVHFGKYSFAYKVNYLICKTTGAFLANFGCF